MTGEFLIKAAAGSLSVDKIARLFDNMSLVVEEK